MSGAGSALVYMLQYDSHNLYKMLLLSDYKTPVQNQLSLIICK